MRQVFRWLGKALALVLAALALFWVLGPREPVDAKIEFQSSALGDDLDVYLARQEAAFADIIPGTEKQIVWAGTPGTQTDLAIIYLHGYSASLQEIRPVPDRLAQALGANLFFTRLAGHGRGAQAMAEPSAGAWVEDAAEALAIGRKLGRSTVVIATSTGGTLAAIAATDPALMEAVAGIAFISPNFAIKNEAAALLTAPMARRWLPLLVGPDRSFEALNEGHATYWTTSYPTVSVLPMATLVAHARGLDFAEATVPAAFIMSRDDKVVSPDATLKVAEAWGGKTDIFWRELGPGDDPYDHVLAGDILSPSQTDETVNLLKTWVESLP